MDNYNDRPTVKKINSELMVNLKTGEVIEVQHNENRVQNVEGLKRTFRNLRLLINNNFTGAPNELFLTLTYAETSRTAIEISTDFDRFIKRLKYWFGKKDIAIEYFSVLEYQERGSPHHHVLLKGDCLTLYIPNQVVADIWRHGFTKTTRLNHVDNIGLYLSSYLTDLPTADDADGNNIIEREVDGKKKKFVKGARLHNYLTGANYYRRSRGIKPPVKKVMPYRKALKLVEGHTLTWKTDMEIKKDGFTSTIHKEFYNSKAKPKK